MNRLYSFGFALASQNWLRFSAKHFLAVVVMSAPFKGQRVGVGTPIVRRKRAGTQHPIATAEAGAAGHLHLPGFLLGVAARLTGSAANGADSDLPCRRPAAGNQISEGVGEVFHE